MKQTCWVWCPYCRVELTRWGDVWQDDPFVVYECPGCGAFTEWEFGAPVPLYLRTIPMQFELVR